MKINGAVKQYIAYGLVIIWVIAVVQLVVKIDDGGGDDIVTAFKHTGYMESESSLESFFYYGDIYLGADDRRELLENVLSGIGVVHPGTYKEERTEDGNVATLSYQFQGGSFTGKLTTVESRINKNVSYLSQYITVEMHFSNAPETAWHYKARLTKVLSGLPYMSITPEVTLSLNGKMSGKLTDSAKKEMAQTLLEQLGAKEVFVGPEGGSGDTYGYTEQLEEYTKVGAEKINVNVAFSYDEGNDVTNLYLATPMIKADY